MPLTLDVSDLDDYGTGLALFGSGGGGRTTGFARSMVNMYRWPARVTNVDAVADDTTCIAVGFVGSTLLQAERLPDPRPFDAAIASIERWLGATAQTVCPVEIGGINGFAPFAVADRYDVIDADLMGRAFPRIDQFSLLTDGCAELVLAAPTGADGVVIHAAPRPEDAEKVMRAAVLCAGGWSGFAIGGFTVGQLRDHAILGSISLAAEYGRRWRRGRDLDDRARSVGGALVVTGRIEDVAGDGQGLGMRSFAVVSADGQVVRVVASSEFHCVLVDGALVTATPHIVNLIDVVTGEILQVDAVVAGRQVGVVSMPGPRWWSEQAHRKSRVDLDRFGLGDVAPLRKESHVGD